MPSTLLSNRLDSLLSNRVDQEVKIIMSDWGSWDRETDGVDLSLIRNLFLFHVSWRSLSNIPLPNDSIPLPE